MEDLKIIGSMDLSKIQPKKEISKSFPTEEIHFFRGKDKKVIGRCAGGKIAIISFNYKGKWINDGDDWICEIIKEDDHKVIVMPKTLTKSSDENFNESVKKLQTAKENGFKKPFLYPENTRFYVGSK